MAGKEKIGGFYYSLGIDTDKGSFARAADSINGLVNIAKTAAAAIGVGFAVKATVDEAINDLNWANKLGIGTYELDKWRAATAQIKINFNSIVGEMDSLDKKFRGIKFGDFDNATATAIEQFYHAAGGQWNESAFETLRNLSPTARFEKLMELAETAVSNGMEDNDVRLLLGKILGGTSGEMFNTMRARKLTMADLFNSAEGAVVDTSKWKDDLAEFDRQLALTKTTLDGLWTETLGLMSEKWLNPGLEKINTWVADNKDEIEKGITTAFDKAEEVTKFIKDFFKSQEWQDIWNYMTIAWEKSLGLAKWIFDTAKAVYNYTQDKKGFTGKAQEAKLNKGKTPEEIVAAAFVQGASYSDKLAAGLGMLYNPKAEEIKRLWLRENEKMMALDAVAMKPYIDKWGEIIGPLMFDMSGKKRALESPDSVRFIHDGIISPGGGITQVDSNDWVLAFKNLEDVAGAFHQGGQAGGVANVTITQTFNVNGNPMPGAVREQAYRGTTSAMSEAFTRAGMVIQMMPGTR